MYSENVVFSPTLIIEPDGDAFHAYSPELPGLHICAETKAEALEAGKHGVLAYLRTLIKHGHPIPAAIVSYEVPATKPGPPKQRRKETLNNGVHETKSTPSEQRYEETLNLALAFA